LTIFDEIKAKKSADKEPSATGFSESLLRRILTTLKDCNVKKELVEESVDKTVLERPQPVIKPLSEISAPTWNKKKPYGKPGHQDGKYGGYKGHGGYNDRHGGNKWDKNK